LLRVIGTAMLLLSACGCGMMWRRSERERVFLLRSSAALIRHARRKIELFGTPSAALFSDFNDGFDSETVQTLRTLPAERALSPVIERLGEDGAALQKFIEEIGRGYKEDTLKLCDYCIASLEERCAAAEEIYAKRRRMHMALPMLFAVSVLVLLL